MKRRLFCVVLLWVALGVVLFGGLAQAQQDVPRMPKEELKPLLGDPNVIVIDVRSMGDWQKDTLMIKGAVREDPVDVSSWMPKYPKDKTLVFYCS